MVTIKNLPEYKSVRDIQVFLEFANFYQCFIQEFSKISTSIILILKTTRSSDRSIPIVIRDHVEKVVGNSNLESIVPKFKKTKMTKFKNLAKLKYLINLLKS